ncbi:MAG: hypothetical protein K2Q22_00460, partial [Cytophagales bacterium]|nr:hypothetical protein [Cytophagales bacterium]
MQSPPKPTITSNYTKDPLHPKACYPNSSTYITTSYLCSGCTINWIKDGQFLSLTNNISIYVNAPGKYQTTLSNGYCTTYSDTIQLQTVTLPSGAISVSNPNCVNDEIVVSFAGSSSPTVNYDWNFYTTSTGIQILSGSGAGPYTIKYPSQGSKPIDLYLRDDICSKYVFTYVNVSNKLTVAPNASSVSRCGSGSVILPVIITDNAQNSYVRRWYDSPTGGNLLQESMGNFFTTPGLNQTTSYFVAFVYNGCEGPRTEVKATIVNVNDPSVGAPIGICGSGLVNLTNVVTSSDKLVWFSNLTSTNVITNPQTLSVSSSAFYYVSAVQTVTGGQCFSKRVPVEVQVYSIPSTPLVSSGSTCGVGVVTLTASGANASEIYLWNRNGVLVKTSADNQDVLYQQLLSSSQVFTVGKLDNKGCKGPLSTVTAQFFPLPVVGGWVSGANPICKGGITSLASNGASSYQWLSEDGAFNSVLQNLTVNPTNPMSYTVTGTDLNGCSSSKVVKVNVNITPAPTAISPLTVCGSSSFSVTVPTISGMSYRWYDTPVGGMVLAYGPILTRINGVGSSTTYYVSQTDGLTGCESERTAAQVVYVPLPSKPLTVNGQTCGNGLVTLTALGAGWDEKYRWFRNGDIVKTSLDGMDNILVATLTGTNQIFQVGKVNAIGCISELANVTANFYSLPLVNAWINGASVICVGGSVSLASNGATTYQWTSNNLNFTSSTQNPIVYPDQSTTFTVKGTDLNGCSASQSVSVTVN